MTERPEFDFTPSPPIEGLDWDQFILVAGASRFYSRVFVVKGEERDVLAALFKEKGTTGWVFAMRFRYYRPDPNSDPFHDNDKRSGVVFVVPPGDKVKVLKHARWMLGSAMTMGFGGDGAIHEIVLETNDDRAILRALKREPFFHMKTAEGPS